MIMGSSSWYVGILVVYNSIYYIGNSREILNNTYICVFIHLDVFFTVYVHVYTC